MKADVFGDAATFFGDAEVSLDDPQNQEKVKSNDVAMTWTR